VVSAKLLLIDDLVNSLNKHLPNDIRIFDYVRVPTRFQARI